MQTHKVSQVTHSKLTIPLPTAPLVAAKRDFIMFFPDYETSQCRKIVLRVLRLFARVLRRPPESHRASLLPGLDRADQNCGTDLHQFRWKLDGTKSSQHSRRLRTPRHSKSSKDSRLVHSSYHKPLIQTALPVQTHVDCRQCDQ